MIDHRSRRAHATFVAALEIDPEKRAEYLADACGGDETLRRAVDRLLAAARTSAGFLESPALGPARGRAGGAGPPEVRGYRLIRILGVGGMATVYEAEQLSPRRRVALKVMHFSLARTSALQRFRFETEVLARLKHAGIAQIYEAGTCDQPGGDPVPFFAMEYVEDARTITSHATASSMPLRARLAMFAEVCDAVQYGHQVGVMHRDLKPGNVLVDRSGRIKVIDFGIARSLEPDADRITRHDGEGQLIGTLNYMSPEQCAGGQAIDTRTDVYALGVMLYELVTGRLPHDLSRASLPEAVRTIQAVQPQRPGSVLPEARGDLEAIILMAIDKEPGRRYDGAGSLALDVRRYLESKTVQARLPSPWHHARLFARRHKGLFVAAAVTAATILIASGLTGWFAYRSTVERDAARRQAYSASISSAYLSYQAGEAARGRQRLDLAPAALRGWEWTLIAALLESEEAVIEAHQDMVYGMAADPSERRFATGSRDGSLALWDLDSGEEIARSSAAPGVEALSVAISPGGGPVYAGFAGGTLLEWIPGAAGGLRVVGTHDADLVSMDCTPSGLLAAASGDGVGRIWSPAQSRVVRTLDDQPGGVHGVKFSADGTRLLTWNRAGAVWLRDTATWAPVMKQDLGGRAEIGAFSTDGRVFAAGGAEGRIRAWEAESGSLRLDAGSSSSVTTVISLALTADGAKLYAGRVDRTISEWATEPNGTARVLARHDEAVSALFLDEQSGRLVSASRDRTVRLWPLRPGGGQGPKSTLEAHSNHILSVSFSPAGDLLATAGRDDVIRLWEPALGTTLATLAGHEGDIYSIRFSPDGRLLASASADGTVRLWSTETAESTVLGPVDGGLWTVAFSPDGSRLAAAGDAGLIAIWDLKTGTSRTIEAGGARIISLAFNPSGTMLASCGRDGAVRLWDGRDGRSLRLLEGHKSDVFACLFSPDGRRLYTGSRDQTVRVWDPRSGELVRVLDCRGQFITSLSIDATGRRLAAGSWFAEVTVWDLETLDPVFSFKGNGAAIRSIAFSPSAPVLVCGGHDGILTTWSGESKEERARGREHAQSSLAAARLRLEERLSRSNSSEELSAPLLEDAGLTDKDRSWMRKAMLLRNSVDRSRR